MYLVEYPDKLLLLDGGCRCDAAMISDYITKSLGRSIKDLKVVIITHAHPDHAGGIGKLKKLSRCKLVTAETKEHWYAGSKGVANYTIDLYLAHMVSKKMKKPFRFLFFNPYFKADFYLKDKEPVPFFPDWQVLRTSGHTDRDLSVYHAESKTAYTADLIIKTKKGFITPFPIYYPQNYKKSLLRIKSLQLKTVMLAHGGIQTIYDKEIDSLITKTPKKPLKISAMTLKDVINLIK